MSWAPKGGRLKWPSRNLAEAFQQPPGDTVRHVWNCRLGFMSPLWRLAGGFLAARNTHIKQKLEPGLGGKIYAMEDRETNFISLLWRTQHFQLESASQSNLVCFWLTDTENGIGVFSFCVEYYQLQLKNHIIIKNKTTPDMICWAPITGQSSFSTLHRPCASIHPQSNFRKAR